MDTARWFTLSAAIALAGCGANAEEDLTPHDAGTTQTWVQSAPVTRHAVPARIDAPGRVIVRQDADARLSVPASGRVRTLHVRQGSRVRAGDPLVVVDIAEAARARADVATLDAERRAARAEVDRQSRLARNGVGLEVERLRAEATLLRADAEVDAARSLAALFGPGDGGTVTLRAPTDGVVVDLDARPGLVVGPEEGAIVTVVHTDALFVRLDVYEDALRRVHVGQRVTVEPTDGSHRAEGSVLEVADAADPATRRGPVLVELDEVPPGWVAGQLVRGRIDADPVADLAVPVSAVVVRPDRSRVVYVDEAGAYVAREVAVGRVVDGLVPVLDGLAGHESVVTHGALLVDAEADRLL